MGCDIHFYTEVKQPDGSWVLHGSVSNEGDSEGEWLSADELYDGRNYNLFAILANVRNGRGFAGIKTGEGFNPISEPRGIPEDVSAEVAKIIEQWDCDGHSHSHHTLRQLLEFDWTQVTSLQGWVDASEWCDWSRYNRKGGYGPKSYSGGVSGPNITHLSAEQMDKLFEHAPKEYHARNEWAKSQNGVYAQAQWEVPYYRVDSSFWSETIPQLLKLAGGVNGVENVRIVFFFDN